MSGSSFARLLGFLLVSCATFSAMAFPMLGTRSAKLEEQAPCNGDCGEQSRPLLQKINIFYEDDRKVAPRHGRKKNPYAAVGALTLHSPLTEEQRRKGEEWGDIEFGSTAFLISPCHILTNQHAAFKDERKPSKDEISQFWVGGQPGDGFETSARAKPVAWGPNASTDSTDDDWAVLELETCLGQKYGWAELWPLEDEKAEKLVNKVRMVGYPGDTGDDDNEMWVDPKCSIKGFSNSLGWGHDCASAPGSSGSPIFAAIVNVKLQVIAFHRGADPAQGIVKKWDSDKENTAVPIAWVKEKIDKALQQPSVWGHKRLDWETPESKSVP